MCDSSCFFLRPVIAHLHPSLTKTGTVLDSPSVCILNLGIQTLNIISHLYSEGKR